MKPVSLALSPKTLLLHRGETPEVKKKGQKNRQAMREPQPVRYSIESFKKKMLSMPFHLKSAEGNKFKESKARESATQESFSGMQTVKLYSERYQLKNLPFAYKEFERSYSRLKKCLDKLTEAGDKLPISRQSLFGMGKKQDLSLQGLYANGKDSANTTDRIASASHQTLARYSLGTLDGRPSLPGEMFQDHATEKVDELIRELKVQKTKLVLLLGRLDVPNGDKIAEKPLDQIFEAVQERRKADREEQESLFVALTNENHVLTQKVSHLEKELEKEGLSHNETLQNFEGKIGRLNEKINDLHKIILDKDRTIASCNDKLKLNNLEQVQQADGSHSGRQASNNSKSIFEDFDGVIKSLLSDIRAKEDYLDELREHREVSYRETLHSNSNGKSFGGLANGRQLLGGLSNDDIPDDGASVRTEMKALVAKHTQQLLQLQQRFERELGLIRQNHLEEREILEIKVKALEAELRSKDPDREELPTAVIDELRRKYVSAVSELNHLKELISRVQRSNSKSLGSQESELLRLINNSKRSGLEGSNGIPSAVLAESKCIFDSLSEESPSVKKAIAEALRAREQTIRVREDEIKVKEEEVTLKLEQTEKWAKNAENLINQKIQEINEARDELDLKAKELFEREKKILEREVGYQSIVSSMNSVNHSEQLGRSPIIGSEENSTLFKESASIHQPSDMNQLKAQLQHMTLKMLDLEQSLAVERFEKERDRQELRSKTEDLMKIIEINSILLAKIRDLGYQYDKDSKTFVPYSGSLILSRTKDTH